MTQFYGALGQAYLANGQLKESQAVLDKAIDLFPRNVPITIRLAETLMHAGDNKRAHLILDDLFNVVEPTPEQTRLIAKAANAAGDIADSYYYMADFYLMSGDLRMAANQLELGLGLPGLDPIQRARISARLEEVRAAMPKDRKTRRRRQQRRQRPAFDGTAIQRRSCSGRCSLCGQQGMRVRRSESFAALSLSACVTLPPNTKRVPQDPWESWNRGVYKVNDKLDRAIAKPVTKAYVRVVPQPVRTGVSNFFANLNTPTVMINDALQGKLLAAANDLGRFLLNSTRGSRRHTRSRPLRLDWRIMTRISVRLWAIGACIPVHSSNCRSRAVRSARCAGKVGRYIHEPAPIHQEQLREVWPLSAVSGRQARGPAVLDETLSHVFDPYAFMRDAYLQRRAYLVSDGKVTEEPLLDPDADNPDGGDAQPPAH